jgi:hypothetical protein
MLPSYFVTAWDYYKGKTRQQHIKKFNIHSQHLPTVTGALFRPTFRVLKACNPNMELIYGRLWAVESLYFVMSANRIAAVGWLEGG